jgi:hypothetical protein
MDSLTKKPSRGRRDAFQLDLRISFPDQGLMPSSSTVAEHDPSVHAPMVGARDRATGNRSCEEAVLRENDRIFWR